MRPPIDQVFRDALQHHRAGKLPQAEALYNQILSRQPQHADALYYLGVIAHQQGRNDQAIVRIRQTLAIKPAYPEAHLNLGIALKNTGRVDEAITAVEQAIGLPSAPPQAHFLLGILLLARGDFLRGWAEYEWRWQCKGFTSAPRNLTKPRWTGNDLTNQTILIHDEQGFGDTLQCLRYIPLLQ